jgi:hypothetical protein
MVSGFVCCLRNLTKYANDKSPDHQRTRPYSWPINVSVSSLQSQSYPQNTGSIARGLFALCKENSE